MLLHQLPEQHKREVNIPSTDPPQGFHRIGDAAKSVTERAILRGYAHGVLSVEATQALIDALNLRGA